MKPAIILDAKSAASPLVEDALARANIKPGDLEDEKEINPVVADAKRRTASS